MKLAIFKHEWREAWRNKRIIWLPIALALLTVMQPVTLHFLPQLLEFGGNLPEGAVIEFPRPSSAEVMVSVVEQLRQLGLIIILLAAMNTFTHERNQGTLAWLRSLRIPPVRIVLGKWGHYTLLAVIGTIAAYALSAYYTIILFDSVSWRDVFFSLGLMSAHAATQLAILIALAAVLSSGLAALAITVFLYLGTSFFLGMDGTFWLPWQLGRLAAEVFTGTVDPLWPLATSVIVSTLCLYSASRFLRTNER